MEKLRVAIFGTGFWSRFQIGGWLELPGAEVVALYNRTLSRAEERAKQFSIKHFYDDAEMLFKNHDFDVADIITDVDTHFQFVEMAARYKRNVICQKPMAPKHDIAKKMLQVCKDAGVKMYVHENYRWQPQVRRVKEILDAGVIGKIFKAHTAWCCAFPVFDNQPFLAELEEFALTDQGSHQFDVVRYLFGEVKTMYCRTMRVNPTIKGEDAATTIFGMQSGVTVVTDISFNSIYEKDPFPLTTMLIEGEKGSIKLDIGPEITVTTRDGVKKETIVPERYTWQDPSYMLEPPSIVSCNRNIMDDLLGRGKAENTGDDNMKTVDLVFKGYESARTGQVVEINAK